MSNTYTQFSTKIEWPKDACTALLAKLRESGDSPGSQVCEFAEETDGVWLYSEENCLLEELAEMLAEVQITFNLGPVGFDYSVSCSKPALGEFGGGAVFIENGKTKWRDTGTWLQQQYQRAEARRNHRPKHR
jgi:hypothetical protein